jgi:DNA-binding GntR family transcriptional regulator
MSRRLQPDRQPLADRMYEVLLGQFMDGTRGPGESLNIGALSRELDVSQTPLREALARLEHTGLVHREALKGYRVAPSFTRPELIKLMDARLVLEPAIAAEAARRRTPEFLDELGESIKVLAGSAAAADADADAFRLYWSSDDRFHGLIAAQTDNPFLEASYRALSGQIQRFRLFMKSGETSAARAADEHTAVYDALEAGEPGRAADRMREHVEGAMRRALARASGSAAPDLGSKR